MKHIYDAPVLQEIKGRLDQLKATSQRQWGTMTAAQMLAHCCAPLEIAVGQKNEKRHFLSFLFGGVARKAVSGPKPFKQNIPTMKSFMVKDERDIAAEKEKLFALVTRMSQAGPDKIAGRAHPFFGVMSGEEWSIIMYKHLDHHFRQFGV